VEYCTQGNQEVDLVAWVLTRHPKLLHGEKHELVTGHGFVNALPEQSVAGKREAILVDFMSLDQYDRNFPNLKGM
jgi:hypothetical protein